MWKRVKKVWRKVENLHPKSADKNVKYAIEEKNTVDKPEIKRKRS